METNSFSHELEVLLRTKAYSELNSHESKIVEKQIPVEEYDRFKMILLSSDDIFKEDKLKSNESEKDSLLQAYENKHFAGSGLRTIMIGRFSLPFYKVSIAAAVLLGAFFLMGWKASLEMQNQAVIYLTDTIYKQVLVPERIWLADSSTRAGYFKNDTGETSKVRQAVDKLHIPKPNTEADNSGVDYETARRLGIAPDINFADRRRNPNRGKSLREDSVLSKFMVSVN
ncbi:MAG: hypothetical protein K9H64_09680 [Bacteroidales bacterium]|nr:hypothetical protein [Bacteroidales bacterium]MCF8456168.1 hypothetical protein [Bacteroidales bacterium]